MATKHEGKFSPEDVEIVRYEDRYREQSIEVLRKGFLLQEMVCIGTEVNRSPQAQRDLEQLFMDVADGGVSLIARHKPTDTVVGFSFNLLQTPSGPDDSNFFEQFRDTKCTTDNSRALMQYLITMDGKVDLFEQFNVACLMEIVFLGTLPGYEGHGIATKIVAESVRLAEQLKSGAAVQLPAAGVSVTTLRPQLVSALCTSRISQRVSEKVGFTVINAVPYSEFVFEGKPYSDRIGPEHPISTLVVKHIELSKM